MPAVNFKSFPLADEGMSWSFSAADGNAIIERGGWRLFKQVHTWFDDDDGDTPETKAAYKLPHHKIVDGDVKTVWRGVTAAMSRLMQQNTQIPEGDRRSCYNHLSRHYREFDEEPPEYGRYTDEEIAEWLVRWGYNQEEAESFLDNGGQQAMSRRYGEPTRTQLEKINALAKRPLTKEEVFVFGAKLAGDMVIPNRYIKIDRSLLKVFKEDAKNGIAFMLDHPWAGFFARPKPALVYGRTFDAVLKKSEGVEGEAWALYADHYLVRGKEKDGISTDAIIADIEDGTLFDTSIGWSADTYECSVCGNDIRDYSKCEHFPGAEYDGEVCYAIARPPGFLMENSGVMDGAYPTAGVLAQNGGPGTDRDNGYVEVASIKQAPLDAKLYHVYSANKGSLVTFMRQSAPLDKKLFALSRADNNLWEGENNMGDKNNPRVYTQEEVDALVKKAKETTEKELQGKVAPAAFISQEQAIEVLGKEYDAENVLKLAKEGIVYREELIMDAVEWGVRAQGNDFPADAWKQILGEPGRTIEAIKDFRDGFRKQAESAVPAGRVTADGDAPRAGDRNQVPDEAFEA